MNEPNMIDKVLCPTCMEVTTCTVRRECGVTIWTCTVCGRVADEDYDDPEEVKHGD